MTFDKWIAQADSGYQQRHRMNMDWWRQVWDAAQAAQRETDAVVAENWSDSMDGPPWWVDSMLYDIAAAIRARGEGE